MPSPRVEPQSVFLNIPYDIRFGRIYLAFIAGLAHLDLTPKATLGIPGGDTRLDRILTLIRSCRYSIHDLSRVQLDRSFPPTPRFNMPFELGLSVAWATIHPDRHSWFVFESMRRRAQKSVSDLSGTDVNIHNNSPQGVMRELCNAFVRRRDKPTVPAMMNTYTALQRYVPRLKKETGANTIFESRMFAELNATAIVLRDQARK